MNSLSIYDVLYDPFNDKLLVVHGFTKDSMDQSAVLLESTPDLRKKNPKVELTTAWIVFRYFEKVGNL